MNCIYFVRHAKPDFSVHEDLVRPLTDEGLKSSFEICEFLRFKDISKIYSSPYKRAIDTIKPLSEELKIEIEIIDDFRERKISNCWIENFNEFTKKQWDNFYYKMVDGESLKEVQSRNINALYKILKENYNENIVIGTHGTALSTIINYFDKDFSYYAFKEIKNIMPFITYMEFEGSELKKLDYIIKLKSINF